MTCEPANHDYQPFARSYNLFCRLCGDRIIITRSPNEEPGAKLPPQKHRGADVPPPLPGISDPDLDAARAIIAEKADLADFEQHVEAILERNNVGGEEGERILRDALAFGPSLDLEDFEKKMAEIGRARDVEA